MPYTKRIVIHAGENGSGLSQCLNYIENEEKTDHGLLKSAYNCNLRFAEQEMQAVQAKFHNEQDERVAYHVVQSFDIRDDITPEMANEIGLKLCKEIYSDYQCVVCTHIDRGHLHNHIVINATNLSGRKLEDRLANKKEGLYGLREASDQVAKEYGCHVMDEMKTIGRFKGKNYDGTKDASYEKSTVSWKSIIIDKIEKVKEETNSLDELLENLALEGYEIKRGKYISVKPFGKERFTRLNKLGEEYSEDALRQFYREKTRNGDSYQFYFEKIPDVHGSFSSIKETATNSMIAIKNSTKGLAERDYYPKYYNSRYKEKKRYNQLIKALDFLNEEKIYSYEDLQNRIKETLVELEERQAEYEKQKSLTTEFLKNEPLARIYLETYNDFKIYEEQVQLHSFEKIEATEAVLKHLQASEELGNPELSEVREFLSACTKEKREANKQYSYITYLKSRMTELERIRGKSLEMNGYVKGMSFSNNMIDYSRTTDDFYCVKLPYTKQYVYLDKKSVAWSNFEKRAVMYLIDDKNYDLYDENNKKVDSVSGEQLEMISKEGREQVKEYYSSLNAESEKL